MEPNPLSKFQQLSGLSYSEISRRTGLPKQTISDLSLLGPEGMAYVRLKTVLVLKRTLGLDLLKYMEALNKEK